MFKRGRRDWRRVVPSPQPKRIFEIRPIRWLLEHGRRGHLRRRRWHPDHSWDDERTLGGVEAVIDKDLASELLAREVEADLFVMATDVDAVYAAGGRPSSAPRAGHPAELAQSAVRRRVDGPKVEAAVRFVEATGSRAAIGALADIEAIVAGTPATQVVAVSRVSEGPEGGD